MFHVEQYPGALPEWRLCRAAHPPRPLLGGFAQGSENDRARAARPKRRGRPEAELAEVVLRPAQPVSRAVRWLRHHQPAADSEEAHSTLGRHRRTPERPGDHQVDPAPQPGVACEVLRPASAHDDPIAEVEALERAPRETRTAAAATPGVSPRTRASSSRARARARHRRSRGRERCRGTARWHRQDPGCARGGARPARGPRKPRVRASSRISTRRVSWSTSLPR